MICPKCGNKKTRVYGTVAGFKNIRFRRCPKCEHTFKTVEKVYVDRLNFEYIDYMEDIGEYKRDNN